MYRPRNRNRTGGKNEIKGPNSALTEFLKEEGINAEVIRSNWLKQQEEKEKKQEIKDEDVEDNIEIEDNKAILKEEIKEEIEDNVNGYKSDSSSTVTDDDLPTTGNFNRRLRSAVADSDEEEYEPSNLKVTPSPKKNGEDSKLERVTNLKRKQTTLNQRKKRKQKAKNLLNKRTFRIPTLQSICISNIGTNILKIEKELDPTDDPTIVGRNNTERDPNFDTIYSHLRDVLGGISTDNLNSLAKALSKNRALNDSTLQLFLKTELTALEFFDCSKISYEGYKSLAIFTPHLKSLTLNMCGQLNNESLLYIMEKLPNLEAIYLDGPFLINEATWNLFFEGMKGRLKAFHISNTHRFTDKNLSSLLSNCGNDLVSLGFSRMDSLFNYSLLPQYLTNKSFEILSIQYPYNEEDFSDEILVNILGQIGSSVKTLILDGCAGLTDLSIMNGLAAFLSDNSHLQELSLNEVDQITDDALLYLFANCSFKNLKRCSLKKCINLADASITELFLNDAKDSLEYLSLNSLKNLTKESFGMLNIPNLITLNLSFVGCVDDSIIKIIGDRCPKLRLLEVFGDNLVTKEAEFRKGITLVGRQSDSI